MNSQQPKHRSTIRQENRRKFLDYLIVQRYLNFNQHDNDDIHSEYKFTDHHEKTTLQDFKIPSVSHHDDITQQIFIKKKKHELLMRWLYLRIVQRLEERKQKLMMNKLQTLCQMQLAYHLKSSSRRLRKMIQSIPYELEAIFWRKLEFCVRHLDRHVEKKTSSSYKETMNTNNIIGRATNTQQQATPDTDEATAHNAATEDFVLIYSTKFEDTQNEQSARISKIQQSYSTTAVKPRLGKVLVLTRWDGIDLLPQNFLQFFTELSHQYSPEKRIRALYMISQSDRSQKKEIVKLHEMIDTFKNNFSLLNIMERKLISWTGNNDYCSLYITCCHFMKNLLAGSCIRFGARGVRARKEQQLYQALEFAATEVQRHVTSMNKSDENFDGNITMEMMQFSAQQLLKEYDGQYHTLFHLLRPFIFEMHKITTIRWFLKKLFYVKKQTRLNRLVTKYYTRLSWLDL